MCFSKFSWKSAFCQDDFREQNIQEAQILEIISYNFLCQRKNLMEFLCSLYWLKRKELKRVNFGLWNSDGILSHLFRDFKNPFYSEKMASMA